MVLLKDAFFQFEVSWICVVLAALLNSSSSSIAKYRLNQLGRIEVFPLSNFIHYLIRFIASPLIWFALILFVASPFVWFISLSLLPLSVAYPSIYSLNILFIFILSLLFLDEKLTPGKLAGALFLIIAFYLFYGDK